MKLAILGPSEHKAGYSTKRLVEEGKKAFKEAVLIPVIDVKLKVEKDLDVLHGKKSLGEFDYVLPRIDSKRAAVGYPVIRFLDYMGVKKPYRAEAILIAHNKFVTLEQLVKNGIKVPATYITGSKTSAKEIIDKMKFPLMLKLLSGFGGLGVMFMESKEAAQSTIETMATLKQEVCLEEFVPNTGEDFRGIVAGGDIIASFKRVAAKGEKRANVKIGGRAVAFKLTPEMEEVVFKAAKAVGSKICAVDLIQSEKGEIFVIEVNINPGIAGIEKATNINVAGAMINFIKGELKR